MSEKKVGKKQLITNAQQKKQNASIVTKLGAMGGVLHVYAAPRNTILTFADVKGNAIKQISCGSCQFTNSKKSMPYASQSAIQRMLEYIRTFTSQIHVKIKGTGMSRDMLNNLGHNGAIQILSIADMNSMPYGGCRKPKMRSK